jgi:hypothetical protein
VKHVDRVAAKVEGAISMACGTQLVNTMGMRAWAIAALTLFTICLVRA